MTVREILSRGQKLLGESLTETPRLEAALLLAHALSISREKLYMELSEKVSNRDESAFWLSMERRLNGEPVAWIVGFKEFWNLPFSVGPGVLCPRPDTEVLVETAREFMDRSSPDVAEGRCLHDCCTGAGSLALALALERPSWRVSASDISEAAENYFRINNATLAEGRVAYIHANLMEGIPGPFDIIVSNPPYLSPAETATLVDSGWKEPELALNGGAGGLQLITLLIRQATARLHPGAVLILEAAPLQMPEIRRILTDNQFGEIGTRPDLSGQNRVIHGRRLG